MTDVHIGDTIQRTEVLENGTEFTTTGVVAHIGRETYKDSMGNVLGFSTRDNVRVIKTAVSPKIGDTLRNTVVDTLGDGSTQTWIREGVLARFVDNIGYSKSGVFLFNPRCLENTKIIKRGE